MDQTKNNAPFFFWSVLLSLFLFLIDQLGFLGWYKNIRSYVTVPFEFGVVTLQEGIGNSMRSLLYLSTLQSENSSLKMKLLELEKLTADQQALLDAHKNVADAKNILALLPYKKTVSAQIIDATVDNLAGYIEINKGKNDGISIGKPVVVKDYYLGYVESMTDNSARVKTIELAGQSIIGYVDKRKISATIKTDIGRIYLDDLLANEVVQLHDIVSVRREKLPYIFPLGTITATPKDTGTAERVGTITPFLRICDISIVTVVLE